MRTIILQARVIILLASFVFSATADQTLLQQGIDVGNTGAETMGVQVDAAAAVGTASMQSGYLGCYADDSQRDVANYEGSGYSRDACINKCRGGGYDYAALQLRSHCFCDNTYGSLGTSSNCNTMCTYGDTSIVCGGTWANSVYAVPKHIGCYVDTAQRDLVHDQGTGGQAISTDVCLHLCREKGFKFAGLQLGSHCFCDNTYGKYGAAPGQCNQGCNAYEQHSARENCGGSWRNTIWQLNPALGSIKNSCVICWCNVNVGGWWGTYSDCHESSKGITGKDVYGGSDGFRCIRDPATQNLKFMAHTAPVYRHRQGPDSCPDDLNLAMGSDICVKFPFGNEALGNAIRGGDQEKKRKSNDALGKILGFIGEYQFCNRPATSSSFLTLSSANVGGGSVSGRIGWNCEMGFFAWHDKSCHIDQGLISGCREFLGHSATKKKFDAGKNGKEWKLIDLQGEICFVFGIGSNNYGSIDIKIGATGSLFLGVLGLFGVGAEIWGDFTIHLRENETPLYSGNFKFEGKIQILGAIFKVSVWIGYNGVTEKWETEFWTPKFDKFARDHGVGSLQGGGGR